MCICFRSHVNKTVQKYMMQYIRLAHTHTHTMDDDLWIMVRDKTATQLFEPSPAHGGHVTSTWVHRVIIHGDLYIIRHILDTIDDFTNFDPMCIFRHIMRDDRIDILELIMTKLPYAVLLGNAPKDTLPALHNFSATGTHLCTAFLLNHLRHEDINDVFGPYRETALHIACRENCVEVVNLLLPMMDSATIHMRDKNNWTAFYILCVNKCMHGVLAFSDHMTPEMWQDALLVACSNNDTTISMLALSNLTDNDLHTVPFVHTACINFSHGVLQQLLLRCDASKRDSHNVTALIKMCSISDHDDDDDDDGGLLQTAIILIDAMHVSDLVVEDSHGYIALEIACFYRQAEFALLIIRKMTTDQLRSSSLPYICSYAPVSVILAITNRLGIDRFISHIKDGYTITPLMHIIVEQIRSSEIVCTYPLFTQLPNDAMSIQAGLYKRTLLHILCARNIRTPGLCVIPMVHLMPRETFALQDSYGNTALHLAAQTRCVTLVITLLENMDTDAIAVLNKKGKSALHLACRRGNSLIVDAILQRCDSEMRNAPRSDGKTPRELFEIALHDIQSDDCTPQDLIDLFPIHVKNASVV